MAYTEVCPRQASFEKSVDCGIAPMTWWPCTWRPPQQLWQRKAHDLCVWITKSIETLSCDAVLCARKVLVPREICVRSHLPKLAFCCWWQGKADTLQYLALQEPVVPLCEFPNQGSGSQWHVDYDQDFSEQKQIAIVGMQRPGRPSHIRDELPI